MARQANRSTAQDLLLQQLQNEVSSIQTPSIVTPANSGLLPQIPANADDLFFNPNLQNWSKRTRIKEVRFQTVGATFERIGTNFDDVYTVSFNIDPEPDGTEVDYYFWLQYVVGVNQPNVSFDTISQIIVGSFTNQVVRFGHETSDSTIYPTGTNVQNLRDSKVASGIQRITTTPTVTTPVTVRVRGKLSQAGAIGFIGQVRYKVFKETKL